MVTRADLYRLIDALPEGKLPMVGRLLSALEASPVLPRSLRRSAPSDLPDDLEAIAKVLNGRGRSTKHHGAPAAPRKPRRRRFTTDQPSLEPMTVDEVGERHTNRWILMEVHERDEWDQPWRGIVLAIGRRQADIQPAFFKAFREPNMQSQGYYTFRAQRPVPPGPKGLAMIERNQLRSAMRGSRRR